MSTSRTVKVCWRKVSRSEAGEHHADAYRRDAAGFWFGEAGPPCERA